MKVMTHHPCKISQWKALDCPDFLPPGRAESNYPAFYILLLPGGPQTCQAPDPFFEEEAQHGGELNIKEARPEPPQVQQHILTTQTMVCSSTVPPPAAATLPPRQCFPEPQPTLLRGTKNSALLSPARHQLMVPSILPPVLSVKDSMDLETPETGTPGICDNKI